MLSNFDVVARHRFKSLYLVVALRSVNNGLHENHTGKCLWPLDARTSHHMSAQPLTVLVAADGPHTRATLSLDAKPGARWLETLVVALYFRPWLALSPVPRALWQAPSPRDLV